MQSVEANLGKISHHSRAILDYVNLNDILIYLRYLFVDDSLEDKQKI